MTRRRAARPALALALAGLFGADAASPLLGAPQGVSVRRYQNFAILGANAFNGPDRSFGQALGLAPVPEQFRAVGTPRGAWVGVRYAFALAEGR